MITKNMYKLRRPICWVYGLFADMHHVYSAHYTSAHLPNILDVRWCYTGFGSGWNVNADSVRCNLKTFFQIHGNVSYGNVSY